MAAVTLPMIDTRDKLQHEMADLDIKQMTTLLGSMKPQQTKCKKTHSEGLHGIFAPSVVAIESGFVSTQMLCIDHKTWIIIVIPQWQWLLVELWTETLPPWKWRPLQSIKIVDTTIKLFIPEVGSFLSACPHHQVPEPTFPCWIA